MAHNDRSVSERLTSSTSIWSPGPGTLMPIASTLTAPVVAVLGELVAGDEERAEADGHEVVLGERDPGDSAAVHERAVAATEVDQLQPGFVVPAQLGVVARDEQVTDHDVVARVTADADAGRGRVGAERGVADGGEVVRRPVGDHQG